MAQTVEPTVRAEYQSRLVQWSARANAKDRAHGRMGNWRLVFAAAIVVLAAFLAQTRAGVGFAFAVLIFGLFLTGLLHNRIEKARDRARRAMGFYQAGLDRIDGSWSRKEAPALAGKSYGSEFLQPHHPFASDLDLFGPGSLFALLNTAQTESGGATLAEWLLVPASPGEIRARQEAINELRLKLDLREELALIAAETHGAIRTGALVRWAAQPRLLHSNFVRLAAFALPIASVLLWLAGQWSLFAVALVGQFALARYFQRPVNKVIRDAGVAPRDLERLAEILLCLENEPFQSERLRKMEDEGRSDGLPASRAIQRLANLHNWMESGNNLLFLAFCKFFLWETQFAFAIESWRAQFGPKVHLWLRRLAEFEALSSLACYSYEHPADPFPELLPASESAFIDAEALGHPLLPEDRCIRNNLALGPHNRLIMISGSNMSGKSTWLRSIGTNLVLASAGAPVRARKFRFTPVRIGASIRTTDSLQEGVSRFYAEIQRLGAIVKLAGERPPLVFLLDEVLSGTNSHDRRIGASCVALSLVKRGAIGLMTTHDLALTRIVDELQPPGQNFHFEDQLEEGRMSFDYKLRPGVVEKSNALELMRSVGLDVSC